MDNKGQKTNRPLSIYDMVRGHNGKSYANELFAQVNDLFYEFGIVKPPTKKKD